MLCEGWDAGLGRGRCSLGSRYPAHNPTYTWSICEKVFELQPSNAGVSLSVLRSALASEFCRWMGVGRRI